MRNAIEEPAEGKGCLILAAWGLLIIFAVVTILIIRAICL